MGEQPFRLSAKPALHGPKGEGARPPPGPFDAMATYALLFLFLCAAGRAWISLRDRAIDDDLVLSLAVAGAAGLRLASKWLQRLRGR